MLLAFCICIYNQICSLKLWFWICFCTADLHCILGCLFSITEYVIRYGI